MQQDSGNRRRSFNTGRVWQDHKDMVRQALRVSIPWFTFVNISFALLILFRHILIRDVDQSIITQAERLPLIDNITGGIIVFSALILLFVYRLPARFTPLCLMLLILSLMWSYCSYSFIVWWQLPFAWPLSVILMLTALAALYYYPPALLLFIIPLWLTALLASVQLNQNVNIRFLLVWLTLTAILIYGRFILQRWFDEAWWRYQENRMLIARLDVMAHQDALTGTANRRSMESFLEDALCQAVPFALIMLDVDYFKHYNDHYGHQAGDACLAKVAGVMKRSVRTPADLVARYGGEEFVVVLPSSSLNDAALVAERIQTNLRETALPHVASAISETVTVSMGLTLSTADDSVASIIARADKALYRAKQQGRNRWVK
ncbi:GGDEF domain-containing protein [Salmonella enterica subsp. enterica serovar Portland]|uniref:membrane-associated sensor domain-containing protein n=1 Tax=Salmonella enterica TaxID=28901 RepID=UPI00126E0411|nr:GGDEF domain-containing protein [Salmonella enterica subsp. enterica serovar Dortmund]ECA8969235.1 GGDEF domain-containing protein [Salmonella enterica subsp. enterica serovar Omuna]ECI3850142.1 GGDEF domain-containing protein [Salmonella enterica subsp. enterica]EDH5629856.1 GGDEF domain-containing protein [Salmonella enterica subsp. enterica serovar Claibornei]EDS6037813.1 GGDEF domain-containing protein [Salmonella enterica subsp. enterica serovar Lexington]EEB9697224.1 GGDEF domain-cont